MIQSFLRRHRKLRFLPNPAKSAGFTLTELLVAMIVAALISSGLLFVVVQLVQTNLREAARSDTQRDLQAAIDYIARDVREAVYVYDANCLLDKPSTNICPGLRSYLPASITNTSTNVPVLAFWRLNPLPSGLKNNCIQFASAYSPTSPNASLPPEVDGVPCLTGQMYSLVVYSLNNSTTGTIARGRARIMRYELPQFTSGSGQAAGKPSVNTGWVDPRGLTTSFLAWPVDTSTLTTTLLSLQTIRPSGGDNLPLTDFVDWNGLYTQNPVAVGQAPDRSSEGLVLTPAASVANSPPRGFYVYVRGASEGGILNQEVLIRIQGDAAGRPGIPDVAANRPIAPISLEARVLTRGVTNKTQ